MKNRTAQSFEIPSEVVSVQIDADTLDALSAAAQASYEIATGLIMVSDGAEI